jgi:hypothetical protein
LQGHLRAARRIGFSGPQRRGESGANPVNMKSC